MTSYLTGSVSNGNPLEQALIRRWWHQERAARGLLVWEYCLEGLYVDGLWFPDEQGVAREESGLHAPERFPLRGRTIVLCEAKLRLTPTLVGQAMTYRVLASRAGAMVQDTLLFAAHASAPMSSVARELGLTVILRSPAADSRG